MGPGKSDHFKQLITFTKITLSSFYCSRVNANTEGKSIRTKIKAFYDSFFFNFRCKILLPISLLPFDTWWAVPWNNFSSHYFHYFFFQIFFLFHNLFLFLFLLLWLDGCVVMYLGAGNYIEFITYAVREHRLVFY